jgi:sec-independent protein translocase protein TatB
MPSLTDSAFIFILALLLFGPKKLPVLARELGKWIGEFRRASNEFKMQMEEELRMSEQADRQKKVAEIRAAAPVAPDLESTPATTPDETSVSAEAEVTDPHFYSIETIDPHPSPIATSGDLSIMPPATGLPLSRTAPESDLGPLIESIPAADKPHHDAETTESATHAN